MQQYNVCQILKIHIRLRIYFKENQLFLTKEKEFIKMKNEYPNRELTLSKEKNNEMIKDLDILKQNN